MNMQDRASVSNLSTDLPIVVDLDRGLLAVDVLADGLVQVGVRAPHRAFAIMRRRSRLGRGAALRAMAADLELTSVDWPRDADLLDVLRRERAAGRKIYLMSEADPGFINRIAGDVGLFDGVIAVDEGATDEQKLRAVRDVCPAGFVYSGYAPARDAVRAASQSIVGGRSVHTAASAGEDAVARKTSSRLRLFLGALRAHQWSKNLLIFVPLILGHKFSDLDAFIVCLLGFVMLCMTISGTYLVNDLADLASDRAHPVKKMRALASGAISAPVGLGLGIALVVLGVAGAFFLAADFGILLSLYVALSLAYSVRLREFALLDVIVIGTLFTLRVLMGIVLADVPISPWLLSFSMFLFTSLALAKRHGELLRMRGADMTVIGRGYQASDWPLTLAFGVAASVASLQVMLIYLAQEAATHYATPAWLALAPAMVLIWLCRIWLLAHRGVLADDPVAFALKDPVSIGLGVLVVAGFVLAL